MTLLTDFIHSVDLHSKIHARKKSISSHSLLKVAQTPFFAPTFYTHRLWFIIPTKLTSNWLFIMSKNITIFELIDYFINQRKETKVNNHCTMVSNLKAQKNIIDHTNTIIRNLPKELSSMWLGVENMLQKFHEWGVSHITQEYLANIIMGYRLHVLICRNRFSTVRWYSFSSGCNIKLLLINA